MKKKHKVTFYRCSYPYDFLLLTEEQVKLLEYLFCQNEFGQEFSYLIDEEKSVDWKEI